MSKKESLIRNEALSVLMGKIPGLKKIKKISDAQFKGIVTEEIIPVLNKLENGLNRWGELSVAENGHLQRNLIIQNINLCLEMNVIVNLYEKDYNISHKE